MKTVLMQLGDELHVRLEGTTYQLTPMGQRKHMWAYFMRAHLAQVRKMEASLAVPTSRPTTS